MTATKALLINLPSPPNMTVDRDSQGGFGVSRPSHRRTYGGGMNTRPPLFLAYAASVLRQNNVEPVIYDALNLNASLEQICTWVKKEKPEVIVGTVSLPSLYGDLALLGMLRALVPHSLIVASGATCMALPNEVLTKEGADVAVGVELEFTLLELFQAIKEERSFDRIPGIHFRDHGKVRSTRPRPFIQNLDELPPPAYDLLPMFKYRRRKNNTLVPFFTLLTSRGCSYSCPYCPYPVGYGNTCRVRSIGNVIAELRFLSDEYQIESVIFRDQVLTFDMERTEELCDQMVAAGLNIEWICETRVNHVSYQLLKKMRKAGCTEVRFGVETGEPEMLETVGKPGATVEDTKQAFKLSREVGLRRAAHVIVGFPDDSWGSVTATANLISEIDPDSMNVFIMTLYPGTRMYEQAKKEELLVVTDWTQYTVHTPVMRTKHLSLEEVKVACEYLTNRFQTMQKIRRIKHNPLLLLSELKKPTSLIAALQLLATRLTRRTARTASN